MDIAAGDYTAAISPFGGGIRALTYRGRPLLHSYPAEEFPPLSAGIVLAPWPNRTTDGVFAHEGRVHRLNITEPARATAIHGFVGSQRWEPTDGGQDWATLRLRLQPQPGWPWPMTFTATWRLHPLRGLRATVRVRNDDPAASCPLGLGWHPYLSAQGTPLDQCILTLPASTNLPLDPVRNVPVGPSIPAAEIVDPAGQAMSGLWLDHCFGGVDPGAEITLRDRETGAGVALNADAPFRWYQVFTADPARREGFPGVGRAVAVEPMTCPPDALRSGRDLVVLAAGEQREFALRVRAVGGVHRRVEQ
ncbi:aldose 1-epimerase family protein [Corynebacterium heidelbergense]|uniref:Aldose epimerase n=1 Tax=Corynebacterium heidelbergense TaxID=2055947 RepID=A0A364VAK9_9CORY|nr:aldose 1-epimerase family protein [Corynebacterium heidelbergense]RAV33644.1 aldose epimerase [Corynebacterium heidelbergense]WCZ37516.1 Aldose 1-epimerase [Corynebacterium heidelbergense]